jgi:hypothetical protein
VGSHDDSDFLLDQGRYTTPDVPGVIWTYTNRINAAGQIVGSYRAPDYSTQGFLAVPVP